MVGLKLDFLWYPIGSGEFFYSFFSTICYRLEKKEWGSKYPIVMKELYRGELKVSELDNCENELTNIRQALKMYKPSDVIWNFEDIESRPPWKDNISEDIDDLSQYFITCEGENLFDVFLSAFKEAKVERVNIEIKNL